MCSTNLKSFLEVQITAKNLTITANNHEKFSASLLTQWFCRCFLFRFVLVRRVIFGHFQIENNSPHRGYVFYAFGYSSSTIILPGDFTIIPSKVFVQMSLKVIWFDIQFWEATYYDGGSSLVTIPSRIFL